MPALPEWQSPAPSFWQRIQVKRRGPCGKPSMRRRGRAKPGPAIRRTIRGAGHCSRRGESVGVTRNSKRMGCGALAVLVVAAAALGRAEDGPTAQPDARHATADPRPDQALDQLQERIIAVSEAVKPSVVHIEAIVKI